DRMPQSGIAHLDSQALLHNSPWAEFGELAQAATTHTDGSRKSKAVPASPPLGLFVAQEAPTAKGKDIVAQGAITRAAGVPQTFAKKADAFYPQVQLNTPFQFQAPADQHRDRLESAKSNVELQRRYEMAAAQAKTPALPSSPKV